MGRERDDFGKPQAPEQKKRARFERKRNPNNNPAGPLSPQNLVCREESVTRKASERGLFPRPAPSNSSNSSSMATNVAQKRNTSFNLNERSTTDKFIDAFLMPQEAKGGYKEFLDTVGLDTNRGLRSTTDELTMKFFGGTDCPPINPFPSYDSCSNQSAAATTMYPSPLGYPERRMPASSDANNCGDGGQHHQHQQVTRTVSRSFSLIMEAYEQESMGNLVGPPAAPPPPPMIESTMPPRHMEILMNSDAPPPCIRDLYTSTHTGHSTNFTIDKKPPAEKRQRALVAEEEEAQRKKHSPGSPLDHYAYERSLSIGSRIVRALERSKTENIDPVAHRRAARQQIRAEKAVKAKIPASVSNGNGTMYPAQISNQMYLETEMLMQCTKALMAENESLKIKLDMMNRLTAAQAKKLEDQSKSKKKK